jgi:transposase
VHQAQITGAAVDQGTDREVPQPWARAGADRPGCTPTRATTYEHLWAWLRIRRITPRIARRGVETSEKLGRHRWVIERSLAWLTGYRRLTLRYERSARLFAAFLTLAATLTCYKKLAT